MYICIMQSAEAQNKSKWASGIPEAIYKEFPFDIHNTKRSLSSG